MISYRPSGAVNNSVVAIWRDGYRAAMTRVETYLLAGNLDGLVREVSAALEEPRGRPKKAPS